jgi:hypothetical protein
VGLDTISGNVGFVAVWQWDTFFSPSTFIYPWWCLIVSVSTTFY